MREKYDEIEDDDYDEDLVEQIIKKGEVIFSHNWVGFCAGVEEVYHWKSKFAICSPDIGNFGPFASLGEALQCEDAALLAVTSATISIQCPLLKAKELAKRLHCVEDEYEMDGYEIEINGKLWAYSAEAGEFKRMRKKR